MTVFDLNSAYALATQLDAKRQLAGMTAEQIDALPMVGLLKNMPVRALGLNVREASSTGTTRWYVTAGAELISAKDNQVHFTGNPYGMPVRLVDLSIIPLSTQIKNLGGPGWTTEIKTIAYPVGKSQRTWHRLPSGLVAELPNTRSLATLVRPDGQKAHVIHDYDTGEWLAVTQGASGEELGRVSISVDEAHVLVKQATDRGWPHHVDLPSFAPEKHHPGDRALPEHLLPSNENRRRLFGNIAHYLEGKRTTFESTLDVVGQLYSAWGALEFPEKTVSEEFQQAGMRFLLHILQGTGGESLSLLEERLWSATGMYNQTVSNALNLQDDLPRKSSSLSMG